MKDTAAIIVAGGKGLRYGGRVRKQYLLLKGRPLVWWSLKAYQVSPSIAQIILVVPKDDVHQLRGTVKNAQVVSGGATRADSVRAGLRALRPAARWVAVHDAVRPLVNPKLIEKVIGAARKFKAAIA